MDSVINRLRNTVTTVTSTVSQLSVVLPGNPVTREYEINQQQQIASAGPGLLWKIYSGYKKTTKQEASIFIFEKKQLDKLSRKDKDAMIEILRKGIQQITKLKHPRILTIQYALEESRDSLAFASEPIFASLANILYVTSSSSNETANVNKKNDLHEMEIKHGLLQICEGLTFLHRDAKILHGNICPESIIINEQGCWKIFGFDFCNYAVLDAAKNEYNWAYKDYESDGNELAQPNLDYLAPEYSVNHASCSGASDMFSLGLVAFTSFNKGDSLIHSNGNWHKYRQYLVKFNTLSDLDLKCIPSEMRYFEKRLLNSTPTSRPDSHEFSQLDCLRNDEGVRTLIFLDSMFQMDNLQKSKFYKGLSEILPTLPQRIRLRRVVPSLAQEFVNPTMVPFVLPNVLKIAEWSSNDEYVKYILPHLRIVLKLREPVQILFIFMKYMELLLQKTPPDITKSDVLPLIYGSLESNSGQVQELCLSIIPSFAALIDFPAMKNSLLPRIKKLCLCTQSLSVRVNCLVCLGKILDHLDKWLVIDFVLPFLTEIPSREPAVIMGIVGIIKLSATHRKLGLTKEIIASKVLPFLFPLSIENGLTSQQFSTIMTFIYELIKIVETEQKSKLEAVGAITREQNKLKTEYVQPEGDNNDVNPIFDSGLEDFFMDDQSSSNHKTHLPKSTSSSDVDSSSHSSSSRTKATPSMAPSRSSNSLKLDSKSSSKDLTSTLINSNLNAMQFNRPPAPPSSTINPASNQWSQEPQQQSPSRFTLPIQPGLSSTSNSSVGGLPMSMSLNNMMNGNNMVSSNSSSSWMGTAAGGGGYQLNNSKPNYNLSNPVTPVATPSAPSNALKLTHHTVNGRGSNNNSKILSKQEIDDFLTFK